MISGNATSQQIGEAATPGIYLGPNAPAGNVDLFNQIAQQNQDLLNAADTSLGFSSNANSQNFNAWLVVGIAAAVVVVALAVK